MVRGLISTIIRKTYTYWRNRARSVKRYSLRPPRELEIKSVVAKRNFFKAVRIQKKRHLSEFLDDVQNIWQAAKFLDSLKMSSFAKIPYLKRGPDENKAETDQEIAETLVKAFFPSANATPPTEPQTYNQLVWSPITEDEIDSALNYISQLKAPGVDELPTKVWRELWPVIKGAVLVFFQTSLETGTVPDQWKIAKIIPLKKEQNGKRDCSKANSWRPISLLCTLGKVMEAVMAKKNILFSRNLWFASR